MDNVQSKMFTYENFSTNLLVECILQHIDAINIQKSFISSTSANIPWDDLRRWLRLTETLIHCLKVDVKSLRTKHGHNNGRDALAMLISQWFPDIKEIRNVYLHMGENDEKIPKEVENLFSHIDILYNLSVHVHYRNSVNVGSDINKKEEIIFVYEDSASM